MTASSVPSSRPRVVVEWLYYLTAVFFFVYLITYYWTSEGGPVLLAVTLVPVTFILFTLDELRNNEFYPRLPAIAGYLVAAVYIGISIAVAVYMHREYFAIGTVRAGIWNTADYTMGALMVVLIMEYARKRYLPLFVLNILLILYAVYGRVVPGMFFHPGLSWERIVSAMSVEMSTGIFSSLPQLALTLIGSFILVLAVLRAFGCINSILKGSTQIAARSPHALPQAAVLGSTAVAAVSGSGAANAITTGSATIPAMIGAGMPRVTSAAIETASSLGGQLMPPIMGISAFLMAEFLGRSYFDVVARGYAPALIYYAGVSLSVYLLSTRYRTGLITRAPEPMRWPDWVKLAAFGAVVGGLILAYTSLGLLWPFAVMHQREGLAAGGATWSDTMHLVLGGVTVLSLLVTANLAAMAIVREREREAAQTAWFWIDPAPGFAWGSDPSRTTKLRRAQTLALALATLLQRAAFPVSIRARC